MHTLDLFLKQLKCQTALEMFTGKLNFANVKLLQSCVEKKYISFMI